VHDVITKARRARSGFTLIELSISLTVLALLLSAVAIVQMHGQKATSAIRTQSDLERRANRALLVVTRELTGLGVHTLAPDPTTSLGTDTVTFQRPDSVTAAGDVIWAAPTVLALLMDEGEADNGVDDDGDGLVDERRLSITRDVGTLQQKTTVLCHGVSAWMQGELPNGLDDNGNGVVDERGFSLRRVGDLMSVRLALVATAESGETVTWTSATALVIHN
jgi:prepilin-type N-terminal cleavage/methylation domain-containing protein